MVLLGTFTYFSAGYTTYGRRDTLPPMFRHLETKLGGDYVTDYIP